MIIMVTKKSLYAILSCLIMIDSCKGSHFNSLWLEKQGVLIEPDGLSIFPTSYKLKKLSVAFPKWELGHGERRCLNPLALSLITEIAHDIRSLEILFSADHEKHLYDYCEGNSFLCDNDNIKDDLDSVDWANKTPTFKAGTKEELVKPTGQNPFPHNRQKRFFMIAGLLLAGAVSLGSSVYSTISVSQLKSAIVELRDSINLIVSYVNSNTQSIETLKEVAKEHSLIIKATMKKVDQLADDVSCSLYGINYAAELMSRLIHIKTTIMETCHDAITGRLTVGMLDPALALSLIEGDKDIKESIYSNDLSVFYLATKVYPIGFDLDYSILHLLLYIPIIKTQDISPTYSVNNYGWIDEINQAYHKLHLPKRFTLVREDAGSSSMMNRSPFLAIPVDYDKCESLGSFLLCTEEPREITSEYSCVMDVINNRIDQMKDTCEFLGRNLITTERHAISNKFGVFLRGYSSYDISQKQRNTVRTFTTKIDPMKNNLIYYKPNQFISVEGKTFISPASDIKLPFTLNFTFTAINSSFYDHINKASLQDEWNKLDASYAKLNSIKTDYLAPFVWQASLSNPMMWVILLVIILVIIGLLVWFCRYKRAQRAQKRQNKNQFIAMRALARRIESQQS